MNEGQFFDEMTGADGTPRDVYRRLSQWLGSMPREVLQSRHAQAEFLFRRIGITFAVYGEKDNCGAADPLRHPAAAAGAGWNGAGSKAASNSA